MIYARFDWNGAELTHHFDKACDGRFEHELTELWRRSGRVTADSILREAAPPVLPAIGAGLGMIPVEIF